MKKNIIAGFILFLAVSVFLSTEVFAAWTQAKGHAYNQLSYSYYITEEKYTTVVTEDTGTTTTLITDCGRFEVPGAKVTGVGSDVRLKKTPKFVSHSASFFTMYGITDKLSVMLNVPYKWAVSDDTKKYACENGPSGIGDIDLTLRYNLTQNLFGTGILMSVDGGVKIPAYKYGYPLSHLSNGDGQYDAALSLVFGKAFGNGYGILTTGYKYRFENTKFDPQTFKPSDQYKVRLDVGYGLIPLISLRANIEWMRSVGNAEVSDEMVRANYAYGGLAEHGDNVIIRDTLGLEPNDLNVGAAVAFNISPKFQTVLSYNVDIEGAGIFETKDYALGKMGSLALVYMF